MIHTLTFGPVTYWTVSDVWQGPGWWLASDGKWYPAEDAPGASPTGDAANDTDTSAVDTAEEVAEEVVEVEPVSTEAAPTETAPVEIPPTETVGAESLDAPATTTSGWQVDESANAEVDDAGWSSGFGDSTAAVIPETTSVEVTEVVEATEVITTVDAATIQTPDVVVPEMPGIDTPDIGTPDIDMPAVGGIEIPDAPTIETPDIDMPAVGGVDIPDAPGIDIPDAPTIGTPDIEMPAVGGINIPDAPGIDIPETPGIDTPDIDMPTVDASEVKIPEFTVPDEALGSPLESSPPPGPDVGAVPNLDTPDAPETSGLTASDMDALLGEETKIDVPEPPAESIERTDAWRSPSGADAPKDTEVASTSGRPEVVDLAIPDQKPTPELPTSDRNWSLIGGAVAVVLLIAAIVWLASLLFSGGDDTETVSDDPPASTTAETEEAEVEDEPVETEGEEFVSVFSLRQGDCIRGDIAGQILEVERVDCEESHDFEVYVERLIDDSVTTEYDEAIITEFSENVCRSALAELVSPEQSPSINFKFLQPTQDSWNSDAEDRLVTCLGFDEDGPLQGRIDSE